LRNLTKSLEIIGRYATRWNEQGRSAPAQGAPSLGWAATCDAVSLQAVAGGAAYTLQSGKALMVGRGGQCAIALTENTVSNTHARLEFNAQSQCLAVTDLGSSNGTFLNGERITHGQAEPGDILRFGSAEFCIAAGAAPPPSLPAAPGPRWMLSGFDAAGQALQFELRAQAGAAGAVGWTIGRDPRRAQLLIDDDSVSGAHAQISYDPHQGLSLRDLGSTNGTRVDGELLGTRIIPLKDNGQELAFGAARLWLSRLSG